MWWIWLLVVCVFFAIALAWSHIHLQFRLYRASQELRLEVKVKTLYGLFRYTFPTMLVMSTNSVHENIMKPPSTKSEDPPLQPKRQAKRRLRFSSNIHIKRSLPTLKAILSHVKCTQFEWRTRIGVDDASATAIIVGSLWAVKSTLVGLISNLIQMKSSPQLAVVPLYHQNVFFTEGLCIVKIRFGYAMVAGILLLVRSLNVKGGIQSWMSTRFKVS